ncbi:hypothetical protein ACOSQ2_013886 [Xanthoceras sorbifolium]
MDMENINDRKKRKMENEEKEEENEEEVKMEQFYALLRNTKDMRDRLRSSSTSGASGLHGPSIPLRVENNNNNNNNNNKEDQDDHQQKKKQLEEKSLLAAWNPSFQPEDFMEDRNGIAKSTSVDLGSTQLAGSSSKIPGQEEQQPEPEPEDDKKDGGNDNNNLDLNLSL